MKVRFQLEKWGVTVLGHVGTRTDMNQEAFMALFVGPTVGKPFLGIHWGSQTWYPLAALALKLIFEITNHTQCLLKAIYVDFGQAKINKHSSV